MPRVDIQFNDLINKGMDVASSTLGGSKAGSIPKPKTDDELHAAVKRYFNVDIPRRRCCEGHVAPFDAFADAFFARSTVSVWKASRGFGGKSMLLALLGLSEAVFLGAKCNILGGSGEQSERVLNYINGEEMPNAFWNAPHAPRSLIIGGSESEVADNARGVTKRMIKLTNGGYLKALMASSKSVRGPHPQRLRLDEVDEMDIKIFDSALGQPMKRFGIEEQTVASSTHQYSNGTMTEILKRAVEKGWSTFEWCYRENLTTNGGWLEPEAVERKRGAVTKIMFLTEYENQEPNPEGRAIDIEKCKEAFKSSLGVFKGDLHEYIEIESPYKGGDPEKICHSCKHPYMKSQMLILACFNCGTERRLTRPGQYAHGADWAKKKDFTLIITFRTDIKPVRLIAFERTGRLAWPVMLEKFNKRVNRYGGGAAHDMTGVGNVVADYLQVASDGVIMQGLPRYELLTYYIQAIEHGLIEFPMIEYMYNSHRLASVEDVYKAGDSNHLPDDIAAGALAYKASGLGLVGEIYMPTMDSITKIVQDSRGAVGDSYRPSFSGEE